MLTYAVCPLGGRLATRHQNRRWLPDAKRHVSHYPETGNNILNKGKIFKTKLFN